MTVRELALSLVVVCGCWTPYSATFVDGPSVCKTMEPLHDSQTKSQTNPPYKISTNTCYTPGQSISVRLHGATEAAMFRGFFVQARRPQVDSFSYGTFDVGGSTYSRTIACFGQKHSAIAHSNSNIKVQVPFVWTAPWNLTGDIEFIASVIKDYKLFWTRQVRSILRQCSRDLSSTTTTTSESNTSAGTKYSRMTSQTMNLPEIGSTATEVASSTAHLTIAFSDVNTGSMFTRPFRSTDRYSPDISRQTRADRSTTTATLPRPVTSNGDN